MPGLKLGAIGGVRGFATAPATASAQEQAFGGGANGPSPSNRGGAATPFAISLGMWALGFAILGFVYYSAPA